MKGNYLFGATKKALVTEVGGNQFSDTRITLIIENAKSDYTDYAIF
jgi:hypothetical protein